MRLAIHVFSRNPIRGAVKTRLARGVGEVAALALHRRMTAHALRVAAAVPGASVELWVSGGVWHPFLRNRDVPVRAQPPGDLGQKMHQVLRWSLARRPAALVLGADIPGVSATHLEAAREALGDADLVLGPARDGGYYLVALKSPQPRLFRGVPWGSGEVLAATRSRARRLGLRTALLEPLEDIDEAGDLRRVARAGSLP